MFWGGVYRENDDRKGFAFLLPIIGLLFVMLLEKKSQQWLTHRFECSHKRVIIYTETLMHIN
jgi:hypothetical protein